MAGRDSWTSPVSALLDGVESTGGADTDAPETDYGSPWAQALREIMERHTGVSANDLRYVASYQPSPPPFGQAPVITSHPDQFASIIATLDSGAEALTKTGYAPDDKNTSAGPLAYTGQRIDRETSGLHDHRAPLYQPTWARFMQPEPIGYQGEVNFSESSQPQRVAGFYGTTGMYNINGRRLCLDCAIKYFGLQGLPAGQQIKELSPHLIKGENDGVDPARPQGPAG